MRKEFGKGWSNEDIDDVLAVRYYIKYVRIPTEVFIASLGILT